VDGTGSGSCPVAGFGVSGVGTSVPPTRKFVTSGWTCSSDLEFQREDVWRGNRLESGHL
jgi:hypothetical protein